MDAEIIERLERIEQSIGTPPKEYVDTKGAADFLSMSHQQLELWRHRRNGGPPFCRVGKRVVYAIKDLREFVEQGRELPLP